MQPTRNISLDLVQQLNVICLKNVRCNTAAALIKITEKLATQYARQTMGKC